jgi:hypothetical protein
MAAKHFIKPFVLLLVANPPRFNPGSGVLPKQGSKALRTPIEHGDDVVLSLTD